MDTYKFSVEGKVQRVGFRAYVRKYASQNGIRGYVKNLKDGSVEVIVNLDNSQFKPFLEMLKDGPNYAEVYDVYFEKINYKHFDTFEIRR
ncbi:MAG: acylphosphatase [Candidatus Woesearchaeota archaeon]